MEIFIMIISIPLAYLLGSIPFGLILTKKAGLGDIRQIGSGNIGATNVLRTGNKKIAAATLLLDGLKGALAVAIAKFSGNEWIVSLSAIAAVCGHIFPYWLQFKGGKGVATTIAVLFMVSWPMALFTCAAWIAMFFISRISSLSALTALILTTFISAIYHGPAIFIMMVVLTGLVVYRHKENIMRLMRGEELSFDEKKKA